MSEGDTNDDVRRKDSQHESLEVLLRKVSNAPQTAQQRHEGRLVSGAVVDACLVAPIGANHVSNGSSQHEQRQRLRSQCRWCSAMLRTCSQSSTAPTRPRRPRARSRGTRVRSHRLATRRDTPHQWPISIDGHTSRTHQCQRRWCTSERYATSSSRSIHTRKALLP